MTNSCLFFVLTFLLFFAGALAKHLQIHQLPSLREQAKIQDGWLQERLVNIPSILQKHGVDAWLISQKEYAEDTTFWSMKKAIQFSARRTLSIFFADTENESCKSRRWTDNTPVLWNELRELLEKCNPSSIAINADREIAFASGLHAGEYENLVEQLGQPWTDRFVNVPQIAVEYVATMPQSRLAWYRNLQGTAWAVISEGFSRKAITPGITTSEDLEWWFREKLQANNYTTWFQPSVTILPGDITPNMTMETNSLSSKEQRIEHGDLLHVDFGLTAMGLNTDTQHLAYVLPPGHAESDIPKGLLEWLKKGNRLQDILKKNMRPGLTGNAVLGNTRKEMHEAGSEGRIYSNPIGDWGHSAGALIGMTNLRDGVPVLGDLPVLKDMYYSIELFGQHYVRERNETLAFPLEEDFYWDNETDAFEWVFGRQEKFHLIEAKGSSPGLTERSRRPSLPSSPWTELSI